MKKYCLALALVACAPQSDVSTNPAPQQLAVDIHNQSNMPFTVYTSRTGADRYRLITSPAGDSHIKLRKTQVDDSGCLRIFVHYLGGQDWISPFTCMLRGGVFDLTVSSQPTFNSLIVTAQKP